MTELLPILVPQITSLKGDFLLFIRAKETIKAQFNPFFTQILQTWFAAGQAGGFLVPEAFPDQFYFAQSSYQTEFYQADLLLQTNGFDPRSIQILRSALLAFLARNFPPATCKTEDEGTEEVRVIEHLAHLLGTATLVLQRYPVTPVELIALPGADPVSDESDYYFYPAPILHKSFDLVLAPQYGRLRRCIVDFAMTVDNALLAELTAWIAPWKQLLELGGFEQPCDAPGMRLSVFGTVQIYDQRSAEIVIDRFDAAEGAWSILVNMLVTFALTHPIVSVEIN